MHIDSKDELYVCQLIFTEVFSDTIILKTIKFFFEDIVLKLHRYYLGINPIMICII